MTDPGSVHKWPLCLLHLLHRKHLVRAVGLIGSAEAGGLLQFSEYRARHANDECSEAAATLCGATKGTEYANVLPQTWIAKDSKITTLHVSLNICSMKKMDCVWIADTTESTHWAEEGVGTECVVSLCRWMSEGFRKHKQMPEPSMLSWIIYTVQDKLFKRNRGFVVGTLVEIWEVMSDKSAPAVCKDSPSWQKPLSASPSVLRLLQLQTYSNEESEPYTVFGFSWKCIRQPVKILMDPMWTFIIFSPIQPISEELSINPLMHFHIKYVLPLGFLHNSPKSVIIFRERDR